MTWINPRINLNKKLHITHFVELIVFFHETGPNKYKFDYKIKFGQIVL